MRQFVALFLSLLLVCFSACAVAEFVSSPTTETVAVVTAEGADIVVADAPAVAAFIESVAAALENGDPAISVYKEQTQATIAALVDDPDALELAEVVAVEIKDYEGDAITATMTFATKFTVGQEVVIVITTTDGTEIVCPGTVNEDGDVVLHLSAEDAAKVNETQPAIASVFAK